MIKRIHILFSLKFKLNNSLEELELKEKKMHEKINKIPIPEKKIVEVEK